MPRSADDRQPARLGERRPLHAHHVHARRQTRRVHAQRHVGPGRRRGVVQRRHGPAERVDDGRGDVLGRGEAQRERAPTRRRVRGGSRERPRGLGGGLAGRRTARAEGEEILTLVLTARLPQVQSSPDDTAQSSAASLPHQMLLET